MNEQDERKRPLAAEEEAELRNACDSDDDINRLSNAQSSRIFATLDNERMKNRLRLFAWRPKGHGEVSFYVVANSREEAGFLVGQYIANNKEIYNPKTESYSALDCEGWGTDYYELEVAEVGQVLTNDNL